MALLGTALLVAALEGRTWFGSFWLGTVAGFKLVVEDRGDYGAAQLEQAADAVVQAGRDDGRLAGLFTNFAASTPWA